MSLLYIQSIGSGVLPTVFIITVILLFISIGAWRVESARG